MNATTGALQVRDMILERKYRAIWSKAAVGAEKKAIRKAKTEGDRIVFSLTIRDRDFRFKGIVFDNGNLKAATLCVLQKRV